MAKLFIYFHIEAWLQGYCRSGYSASPLYYLSYLALRIFALTVRAYDTSHTMLLWVLIAFM